MDSDDEPISFAKFVDQNDNKEIKEYKKINKIKLLSTDRLKQIMCKFITKKEDPNMFSPIY